MTPLRSARAAALALVCAVLLAPASDAAARRRARPYLEAAEDAARWIRSSAVRTGAGMTWPVDPAEPKSIAPALYSGSPGVVLFLLELHQATGKPEYLVEARAGADELIATLPQERQTGLYTGVAGIGFALGEVFRATGDPKYREGVSATVKLLEKRAQSTGRGVQWSPVTDIIGGTAGTGLFLLQAGRTLPDRRAIELAVGAADALIELGTPERGGLRWAMDASSPRLMPNFSHGTAGIAYFLASVYEVSRDARHLDAALAGARYLQAIATTEGDICLIPHHQPDGLDLYYLGWCHGPVGTARLWYRLAQVHDRKTWMPWVDRSARALLQSGIPERRTDGFWNNVSQCCGSAGVAQFFLDLHATTKEGRYLEFAKRMTADLLARGTKDEKGLRWIQAEHRVRPELLIAQTGYMQGAAGVGLGLLRLDAAETGRRPFVRFPDDPW
jgi:lantibiotic modifying enzyme